MKYFLHAENIYAIKINPAQHNCPSLHTFNYYTILAGCVSLRPSCPLFFSVSSCTVITAWSVTGDIPFIHSDASLPGVHPSMFSSSSLSCSFSHRNISSVVVFRCSSFSFLSFSAFSFSSCFFIFQKKLKFFSG